MPPAPSRATPSGRIHTGSQAATVPVPHRSLIAPEPVVAAPASDGHARLLSLADRLTRTVSVARALVASGRVVDLAGFEDGVGLLCAKTLDLQRDESRVVLPALLELSAQIDRMTGQITALQARRYQLWPQDGHPPSMA
jgi:hypothetical protein